MSMSCNILSEVRSDSRNRRLGNVAMDLSYENCLIPPHMCPIFKRFPIVFISFSTYFIIFILILHLSLR